LAAESLQSREMTESDEASLVFLFEFVITGYKTNNFTYSRPGRLLGC
jgi:hypothetical protein